MKIKHKAIGKRNEEETNERKKAAVERNRNKSEIQL